MTKKEIEKSINLIFDKVLNIHIRDKNLFDDIGMDSLDRIELAMSLEEKLKIIIPDEEWNSINSISETIDYIEGKINNV